jgi:predicted small metal-binding protein
MTVTTSCKGCGIEFTAEDEDTLATQLAAHLREAHPGGHSPSHEQILAVIRARTERQA